MKLLFLFSFGFLGYPSAYALVALSQKIKSADKQSREARTKGQRERLMTDYSGLVKTPHYIHQAQSRLQPPPPPPARSLAFLGSLVPKLYPIHPHTTPRRVCPIEEICATHLAHWHIGRFACSQLSCHLPQGMIALCA